MTQGYYFSGDGCRRDEDGFYWITGRVDDVINVSGHRIGTAEVESALGLHPQCAEAAVVGLATSPHLHTLLLLSTVARVYTQAQQLSNSS